MKTKIWVTGASGQLGTELRLQLIEEEVIGTDLEVDITNEEAVNIFAQKEKPQVIINCAAHTAVDKCEEDVDNAYNINANGAKHLAQAAERLGAKFVQVSTDYVFNGEDESPRKEEDATDPQSVYGASKLLGETYTRELCKKHFIIRTAWLYGEGNNFVRTMLKLAETQKELNVVGDQWGSPTSTKDLAKAITCLIKTDYYGTFHGTCEGICSWYQFAKEIFKIKGIDIKVNEVTSEAFVRPAKRPHYSVLENSRLKAYNLNVFRDWKEALEDYLKDE